MAERDAGGVNDPLRYGTQLDEDMEDLTAHLAGAGAGRHRGGSHDGELGGLGDLDLGDTAQLQGNLDRFRSLAGPDDDDDPLFGPPGLGLGLGGPSPAPAPGGAPLQYPTYGQLAAATAAAPPPPPSYEDSVMCERAPQGAAAALAGAAAAAGAMGTSGGGGGDPLTGGSGGGRTGEAQGGMARAASASSGGGGGDRGEASGHQGSGQGQGQGGSLGGGGWGGGPPVLDIPGSADYGEDLQALSPPRGALLPACASASPHSLVVTVTDPIKREQGGLFGIKGGYVTYLVRSRPRGAPPSSSGGAAAGAGAGAAAGAGTGAAAASRNGVSGTNGEHAVRRRFREFVSLADLLKHKYRGYFVPPRPEKNAVEGQRMTDAFVEERRLALERYMNKLVRHPVISASEELRLFLTTEGELGDSAAWVALGKGAAQGAAAAAGGAAGAGAGAGGGGGLLDGTARLSKQLLGLDRGVTDPVQAAQPTKTSHDLMRAFKEKARSMQAPTSAPPPDEAALQAAREELEGLGAALAGASRAAEKLLHAMERHAAVCGDLGMSLFRVGKAEEAEGGPLAEHTATARQTYALRHHTARCATALVRVSRIGRKTTGRSAIELGCLHEYLGLMPAAHKGLRARDKALLTADTLTADLEARNRAIGDLEAAGAKVLGGDTAKAKKVNDLRSDVAVLQQSIAAARGTYDRIKAINQEELSRLRSEWRSDLGSMLTRAVALWGVSAHRDTEVWLQAASELDATPEQLQAARAPLAGMVGAAGVVGAGPGGSAAGGPGLGAGVSQGVGKAGGAEALGAGAGAGAGNGLGGFPL